MFLKRKIVLSTLATIISSPTIPAVVLFSANTPAFAQLTQSQGRTIVIPAGTTFEGRIDATLSSRKSHQGDRFNVILSSPVLANGTDVLIPAGAMVIGEVVEAMASNHQPHEKKQHVSGKLRVQITALKMPDGTTYPLVGSFIGETTGKGASKKVNPNLGGGVAYIGSQTNFNAVYPNSHPQGGGRNNRGPQLVTKKQMMDDPLLGDPDKSSNQQGQAPTIRSLVKDHYDLFIHEGSPMSVRLDAPLKMAIAPIGGMTPSAFSENDPGAAGRPTFSRPRSSIAAPPSPQAEAQQQMQQQPQAVAPPVPTGPAFLEPAPGTRPMTPPPQAQMQQQMPMQSFGAPQGVPQSMPSAAPPGGGWFRPSTPADQAAAAQATPYFNAAPPAAQATPVQSFAQPQAPPAAGGFGAYQAPAQTAPSVSAGGFGAMPQQAVPQQALQQQPIQQAMPQQAMPQQAMQAMPQQAMQAMPQQATAAPGLMAQPAGGLSSPAAPPMSAAPVAPLSAAPAAAAPAHSSLPSLAPPVLPPAPPAGQSLDTFINSLGGAPASGAAASPTSAPAAAPATPAAATPAAVPEQKAP